LEEAIKKKQPLYLYKIALGNINYFDFYRGFRVEGDLFVKEISRLKFEQNAQTYEAMNKYKRIGREGFENYLADKLRDRIAENFVAVNELHIEGPVQPHNIAPLMPPRLEYLDLAVNNYSGHSTIARHTVRGVDLH
jgi:hypothetical protein